ncbi:MAG: uroporphyrinogen decarboxylase [Beijerinckiaceae bacterium]
MVGASSQAASKKFLRVLSGQAVSPPPIWLMRQAGRYLPEYKQVRAEAGSFLDLCFNPKLAAEVTLQPIRRFGFDAAILFSDILVIPHALGQTVSFEEGHGPRLTPVVDEGSIARLPEIDLRKLDKVFEAVSLIAGALPAETAFIGFCGAPWTVASYMIAGSGSKDLALTRLFAFRYPDAFQQLIDLLARASVEYLVAQAKCGVEAVQIFDSWCGLLPVDEFDRWCVQPVKWMVSELRARCPDLKIIVFPREAGNYLPHFRDQVSADCIAVGTAEDLREVRRSVGPNMPLQGNLDPLALVAGGSALDRGVKRIVREFGDTPFVFNLGHGILPETPIAHVERLVRLVRDI